MTLLFFKKYKAHNSTLAVKLDCLPKIPKCMWQGGLLEKTNEVQTFDTGYCTAVSSNEKC